MRIISGKYKGKKINAPSSISARPTTDFAKEALFNILNNRLYFDEISVLDLFAGIGSISFEFASRGVKRIASVDKDYSCTKFIKETADSLMLSDEIQVFKSDVFKFLEKKAFSEFDVIFADPPYDLAKEDYLKIIELAKENKWLKEEGLLILEHSSKLSFDDLDSFAERRKYGNVHFSLFCLQKT